jgi:hypothetical protein
MPYKQQLLGRGIGAAQHAVRGPLGFGVLADSTGDAGQVRGPLGVNRPAAGGTPAIDDRKAFELAIAIFEKSPQSATPIGGRILATARKSLAAGSVSFRAMQEEGISTTSTGEIAITVIYRPEPMLTSIWLVHEAYHVAVKDDGLLYVDEELASRTIQGEYWAFLEDTGVSVGERTYRLAKSDKRLPIAYREKRIIDWVIPMYKEEKDFVITPKWIIDHKGDEGGLKNRTSETRAFYATTLIDAQPTGTFSLGSIDPKAAEALLELFEAEPFNAWATPKQDEVKAILEKLPTTMTKRRDALFDKLGWK